MRILIDHKIRIPRSQLSADIEDSITEALSIPNIERQNAMEQGFWGWQQMPETIDMWSIEDHHLVMPRGFRKSLLSGLDEMNINCEIIDERVYDRRYDKYDPVLFDSIDDLYSWQENAKKSILFHQEGIWKAPTGSGKTIGVLDTIRSISAPAIILVNRKTLLHQWVDRAKSFFGEEYPVSLIGDGYFEISDYLTIASVQTIHSRFDKLEKLGFFDQFSFMCLDECHHATSVTCNKIVSRFSSRYRIGVSATPNKTGDFDLATLVLGPIIHETKHDEVLSIIAPEVVKVTTSFSFNYIPKSSFSRQSNYPELLSNIVTDQNRNKLIVKTIMMNSGHHCLLISKRLEHLDYLADELEKVGYSYPVLLLTGKESSEDRDEVIRYVSDQPCIVLSTLADEALDIPALDRLFLVFPQRNIGLLEQQVGRICRSHPDKEGALVFDFADLQVGPLEAQWRLRRNFYRAHEYKVSIYTEKDIMNYED